jgi:hypothetical protein
MILVFLVVTCMLTVPLTGGRLSRMGQLQLRLAWAAPLAVTLQIVIVDVAPGGARFWHTAIHLGTYGLGGAFLWANRRLPGAWLITVGTAANALAIAANAGVMPAAATAQRLAGLTTGGGFQNSAHLAHPHLLWLGDVIPVPGPWPLGNVLSVGDCLLFAGMLVLLHVTCRTSGIARPPVPDVGAAQPTG